MWLSASRESAVDVSLHVGGESIGLDLAVE